MASVSFFLVQKQRPHNFSDGALDNIKLATPTFSRNKNAGCHMTVTKLSISYCFAKKKKKKKRQKLSTHN